MTAMNETRLVWIGGGVAGIISALVMIPAYLVGSPDLPQTLSSADSYFDRSATYVFANGTLPLLHLLAFLLFLVALVAAVRLAAPRRRPARALVLAGGTFLAALTAAGLAVEIVVPATMLRFPDAHLGSGLSLASLTLSSWLYHYSQIGSAVMIVGVIAGVAHTRLFPEWFVLLSWLFVALGLVHTWLPLVSATGGLVWIALAGVTLLVRSGRATAFST